MVGFSALASTSMQQARIAVEDMFDLPRTSRISSLLPMGIYTIPAIASIGPTEAELRESGRPIVIGRADYRRNARGRMLEDDQGLVKLIFDRGTRTLLHASIIGEDATELVHLAMMALAADWRIEDFRDTCFTYPSLGAPVQERCERRPGPTRDRRRPDRSHDPPGRLRMIGPSPSATDALPPRTVARSTAGLASRTWSRNLSCWSPSEAHESEVRRSTFERSKEGCRQRRFDARPDVPTPGFPLVWHPDLAKLA